MARAFAQPTAPTKSTKLNRNSSSALKFCSPALRHRTALSNPSFRSAHNKSQTWRTTVARSSTCKPAFPDDNPSNPARSPC
jgi:hypothetical protein